MCWILTYPLFKSVRLFSIFTILFFCSGIVQAQASTNTLSPVRVIFDANDLNFKEQPYIKNSTTLVPFRTIFEKLGLTVSWEPTTRKVTGQRDDITIVLQIDNPIATVNGKTVTLTAAPELKNDTTFVPLRFVSESVDSKVDWDPATRTALINSKKLYSSSDDQFRFAAYGLWSNMTGLPGVEAEDVENATDFLTIEEVDHVSLALRYFNYTMLFISNEPLAAEIKDLSLEEYVEHTLEKATVSETDIVEKEQIEIFGNDAIQITYYNHEDWDDRVDTLIVFRTDSGFYCIRNSSYADTYKESILEFQEILDGMEFSE